MGAADTAGHGCRWTGWTRFQGLGVHHSVLLHTLLFFEYITVYFDILPVTVGFGGLGKF